MFKNIFLLLVGSLTLLSSIQSQNHLVSYEKVASYNKKELTDIWKQNGIPKIIVPIKHGIDIYEIIYNTTYFDGSVIKASGIYFVPNDKTTDLPQVVYFHGTQIQKERKIKVGGEQAICIGFATGGFAVSYVDYMGLGKGERNHIYQHAETQAVAGVDMLKATHELNEKLEITTSDQLFATGYSQGGHATMSFHKFTEEHPEHGFKVTASSPMSGAYDMVGSQKDIMFEPYSHPGYLPYLLIGYNKVYGFYNNLWEDVIIEPYSKTLPPLFDGTNAMGVINKNMPDIPASIIKPEIINEFKENPDHPLTVALQDNSFTEWVPKSPVQMCYCKADEQVHYSNAINTHKSMKENGAERVLLRLGGRKFDHNTCALFAAIHSKLFFESIVKGKSKGKKGPWRKRIVLNIGKIKFRKDIRQEKRKNRREEKIETGNEG